VAGVAGVAAALVGTTTITTGGSERRNARHSGMIGALG